LRRPTVHGPAFTAGRRWIAALVRVLGNAGTIERGCDELRAQAACSRLRSRTRVTSGGHCSRAHAVGRGRRSSAPATCSARCSCTQKLCSWTHGARARLRRAAGVMQRGGAHARMQTSCGRRIWQAELARARRTRRVADGAPARRRATGAARAHVRLAPYDARRRAAGNRAQRPRRTASCAHRTCDAEQFVLVRLSASDD